MEDTLWNALWINGAGSSRLVEGIRVKRLVGDDVVFEETF